MWIPVHYLAFAGIAYITEFVIPISCNRKFVPSVAISHTPTPAAVPKIEDANTFTGIGCLKQWLAIRIKKLKGPLGNALEVGGLPFDLAIRVICYKIAMFTTINVVAFQDDLTTVVKIGKFTDERLSLEIIRPYAFNGLEFTVFIDLIVVVVIKEMDNIAGTPLEKYGIVLGCVGSKCHRWRNDDECYG